jgi:hypothetical protein
VNVSPLTSAEPIKRKKKRLKRKNGFKRQHETPWKKSVPDISLLKNESRKKSQARVALQKSGERLIHVVDTYINILNCKSFTEFRGFLGKPDLYLRRLSPGPDEGVEAQFFVRYVGVDTS